MLQQHSSWNNWCYASNSFEPVFLRCIFGVTGKKNGGATFNVAGRWGRKKVFTSKFALILLSYKTIYTFFHSPPIFIPLGTESTEHIKTKLLLRIWNRNISINKPLKWATRQTPKVWLLYKLSPYCTSQPFNSQIQLLRGIYLLEMMLLCQQHRDMSLWIHIHSEIASELPLYTRKILQTLTTASDPLCPAIILHFLIIRPSVLTSQAEDDWERN